MPKFFLHLLLFFITLNLPDVYATRFSEYDSISEIPEPLVFDLVRRLGAPKGEFEINSLVQQESQYQTHQMRLAPEIEYVVLNGLGLEIELPSVGSKAEALKTAEQYTFGEFGKEDQFIHGIQLIQEKYFTHESNMFEHYMLYLFGHRINSIWSYLIMAGHKVESDQNMRHHFPVLNFTLFYFYSHEIEFGLEHNIVGIGNNFQYWRVVPQFDLILRDHWKIQLGFGALFQHSEWQASSNFRIIKEFY